MCRSRPAWASDKGLQPGLTAWRVAFASILATMTIGLQEASARAFNTWARAPTGASADDMEGTELAVVKASSASSAPASLNAFTNHEQGCLGQSGSWRE